MRPMAAPGILVGLGLGGFVDGILFHQVLQWHHMISHIEPPTTLATLELNTLADGLFHVATWLFVTMGIALWWSRRHRVGGRLGGTVLWGWVLVGWGVFNVVEGVVNHHILEVHHVRDDLGGPLGWDVGFLALGAVLIGAGWSLVRAGHRSEDLVLAEGHPHA